MPICGTVTNDGGVPWATQGHAARTPGAAVHLHALLLFPSLIYTVVACMQKRLTMTLPTRHHRPIGDHEGTERSPPRGEGAEHPQLLSLKSIFYA
jgi:hypothetical protein